MKILIAAEIFPPDIGGPATYSAMLVNELTKRDFRMRILCYGKPDKDCLDKKIKINWVSKKWPIPIKYFLYFLKLLFLTYSFDVIYAQGPVSSGYPVYWLKKIIPSTRDKKMVVKIVGDYAWEQASQNKKTDLLIDDFQKEKFSSKIGWLQKIEKEVCRKADKIITPSNYLKKIVQGWGVNENKIEVIYNAIPQRFVRFKEDRDLNLIVSAGRLVPWKGFETLIKLMPELLKENKSFKLMIFGAGPEKERLSQLILDLNLKNHIFLQKVDQRQLLTHLAKAGVFVLNSGYEGFSHLLLEVMQVGVPIITTRVGGNLEIIQNNYSGLLVEYNNQKQLKETILKIYCNSELREEFVRNSKEVLKNFTFEKMINKTIEVFKD